MKNQKIFLSLFLIIILLILIFYSNIGLAADFTSNTTNQYSPNDSELNITFDINSNLFNKLNIIDETAISFDNINLEKVGEKQTIKVPIINNNLYNSSKISLDVENSNTEYFKVSASGAVILKPNQSSIIEITIELIKLPINETETTNININVLSETIYK